MNNSRLNRTSSTGNRREQGVRSDGKEAECYPMGGILGTNELAERVSSTEKKVARLSKEIDEITVRQETVRQEREEVKKCLLDVRSDLMASMREISGKMQELCDNEKKFEVNFPFLLACVQQILGHVRNAGGLYTDAQIMQFLKEDADTLQYELERNGITVAQDLSMADNGGFDKVHRDGVSSSDGVVASPVILRNGVVVRRGKLFLPSTHSAARGTGVSN